MTDEQVVRAEGCEGGECPGMYWPGLRPFKRSFGDPYRCKVCWLEIGGELAESPVAGDTTGPSRQGGKLTSVSTSEGVGPSQEAVHWRIVTELAYQIVSIPAINETVQTPDDAGMLEVSLMALLDAALRVESERTLRALQGILPELRCTYDRALVGHAINAALVRALSESGAPPEPSPFGKCNAFCTWFVTGEHVEGCKALVGAPPEEGR